MSNITNMKNLIRFSKLSLNEAFQNDGYRYDPKTSELSRDQRIPVVDFEARLNLIFELQVLRINRLNYMVVLLVSKLTSLM